MYKGDSGMFDFDKQINRYNSNSVKFDVAEAQGYPADVLPLWVADMDFQAPECVTKALHEAADFGIFGYSFLGDGYVKALQNWFAGRFDWQVKREWIVTTPGVVFALSAAVRVMTQPGDAVLVQPPVYYPFYNVIVRNDRRVVESPLVYENGKYTIDFADFEEKLRANSVKLFILCSPHNPVCRVWTEAELRRIGELCEKYGVQVIADEIHCDFTLPGFTHTPFLKACPSWRSAASSAPHPARPSIWRVCRCPTCSSPARSCVPPSPGSWTASATTASTAWAAPPAARPTQRASRGWRPARPTCWRI